MRAPLALLSILVAGSAMGVADAQPLDPYAPAGGPPAPGAPTPDVPPAPRPAPDAPPAPPPGADDPVLAEQIAQSLVHRAQELYDARVFVDAKQLAVEALVKSPRGAAADHARYLIKTINKQLGITDEPAAPDRGDDLDAQVDKTPFGDRPPPPPALPPPPEGEGLDTRRAAMRVHGGLYLGLIGASIGSLFSEEHPAGGAVPLGIVGAAGGAMLVPRVLGKRFNEAQIRTVGSGSVWGGVIGGLFADTVKVTGTTSRHVLLGASIGSTVGLVAGAGLARRDELTRGDVALIDTLAGIGTIGGLTMGMLMQPAEGEAYGVNSILGAAGGVVVGLIAAPKTNTTPRRMLRVAGAAAIGGGAPFLLYAAIYDGTSSADERVVGALSTVGLVGGLVVGLRLTRTMDVDLDVREGAERPVDDAPAAVIGRHSDGRWALGEPGIQPLSALLAPQPGMSVSLVGGTF